jgi:hypothetical protein
MGSVVAQNGGRRHRVRAKTYAEDARGLLVNASNRHGPAQSPAGANRPSALFGQC